MIARCSVSGCREMPLQHYYCSCGLSLPHCPGHNDEVLKMMMNHQKKELGYNKPIKEH